MKPFTIIVLLAALSVASCASNSTLKSPCVGAAGSPCSPTPLSHEPIVRTT